VQWMAVDEHCEQLLLQGVQMEPARKYPVEQALMQVLVAVLKME
jgi:hypothetical protein